MIGVLGAFCALWTIALVSRDTARADGPDCTPTCVILIQVDGLEPKDVTQATTPYLWSLAHPQIAAGNGVPGGALANRSGWIWQAPRGVVSTGTASATAALLTGGYPEMSSVPADEFYDPTGGNSPKHQRLGAGGFGDVNDQATPPAASDGAVPVAAPPVTTVMEAVKKAGGETGIFLADPGLANVAHANSDARAFWFPPGDEPGTNTTTADSQFTGDPRLCPIPRTPDGGDDTSSQGSPGSPSTCPANDLTTVNKAVRDLQASSASAINFTFIELAELGAAKRRAGDLDVSAESAPPTPTRALGDTDTAIATFVEQYAQNSTANKWKNTVLMVVGSHGYQMTPLTDRVPDPTDAASASNTRDPTPHDLADYVHNFSKPGVVSANELTLVPQGTMATIYFHAGEPLSPADQARRPQALAAIKTDLMLDTPGSVNAACNAKDSHLGGCISQVLYLDKDTPVTSDTVDAQHPTWHLDVRDPDKGFRTGVGGDLAVVLSRGWATGRAVGSPGVGGTTEQPVSNPYMASSGGPQERAVAALINGPSGPVSSVPGAVRNLGAVSYYPVSNHTVDPRDAQHPPPSDDPKCALDQPTDPGGLVCANDPTLVGDDSDKVGHEAQPNLIDFAITISALMRVPFDDFPTQLQGRVLQEAFLNQQATPCIGDACEPPPPPEEPPPPPLPPPPPPEVIRPPGFNFFGLVRALKAQVVDSRNRPYSKAKAGSTLSTVRLEGDFGKPEAALTLTFYRATGAGKAKASRRLALKAIARFDPFVVKRGHVTIRLKVPPVFSPTYVGVTVREVVRGAQGQGVAASGPCTKLKTAKPVKFQCTGPSRAVIAPIVDAAHLHKPKGRSKR